MMNNDDLLKYFINHTDRRFQEVKETMERVEVKIEELNKFKWKVTGIAGAVVFIIELGRVVIESKIRG